MSDQLETLLSEQRRFPPPPEFAARAARHCGMLYAAASRLRGFWAEQARALDWIRPWDRVLEWNPPHAKWFVGGKLNVSVNCLDRHLRGPAAQQGRDHLGRRARRPAGAHLLGPGAGGRPLRQRAQAPGRQAGATGSRSICRWCREAAIAMLACARIGAVHSVVFGGFSAEALRDRINDAAGGRAHHRRRRLPARPGPAAQALRRRGAGRDCPRSSTCSWSAGAPAAEGDESFAHDDGGPRPLVAPAARPRAGRLPSPRRWMRRTCSSSSIPPAPPGSRRGSSTPPAATSPRSTSTAKHVFDLKDEDVFWCTADIGWVTGHSLRRLRPAGQRRHRA